MPTEQNAKRRENVGLPFNIFVYLVFGASFCDRISQAPLCLVSVRTVPTASYSSVFLSVWTQSTLLTNLGSQIKAPLSSVVQDFSLYEGRCSGDSDRSRTPPSRSRPRPRIPAPALAPPCGQPERPAWTRSVPFALLKEQGPHLGRGSRRWCRAALGETDGTMKEDPPPHRGAAGPRGRQPRGQTPSRGGSSACPTPDLVQTLLTGGGEVQVQQEVGRSPEALYLRICSPPSTFPAPPQEYAKSRS